MNKPASYEQTRIHKRNLAEVLVHKFLTEYGYDHGPVIARASPRLVFNLDCDPG